MENQYAQQNEINGYVAAEILENHMKEWIEQNQEPEEYGSSEWMKWDMEYYKEYSSYYSRLYS